MEELLTTPEVSKKTGIPAGTIRSWLTRYPDLFQLGIHLIQEESGRKLWTSAGVELLQSRVNGSENAALSVADSDAQDLLEAILQKDADTLAAEYWRRLPGYLMQRILIMRQNPTPQQRELVQSAVAKVRNAGTSHLLLPTYQPMLLEGGEDATEATE